LKEGLVMDDLFISDIYIEKVRHLEDINIEIAKDKKRHLILTGKNGSGKTSLLEKLAAAFAGHDDWDFEEEPASQQDGFFISKHYCLDATKLSIHLSSINRKSLYEKFIQEHSGEGASRYLEGQLKPYLFLPMFTQRRLELRIPQSIEAVDLETTTSAEFLKYMLYLNYQKLDALVNNNNTQAEKVANWFDMFESVLRKIYDCLQLELTHNSKDLSFKISMPDREPFGLNEMADGFSSLLYIVVELLMKMESRASLTYDVPGIVFIDEIETHLHVELQRLVLPFLVEMFPRIQFIVTTHSPFVISSLRNAIVFDLERRIRVEDMSNYSYEGIIEHYYDLNQYSEEANHQFAIYQSLVDKENRTTSESEQFIDARTYLKQIPVGAAQELVYAFRDMEAKRKAI